MKKNFSLIAIAAVAVAMFTSCGDGDKPNTGPKKAKLTLSVNKDVLKAGDDGIFTVTSDIAAPEAIVITVKSSAAATLTVDPATVTIKAGEKKAEGTFKAVADGKATISITAEGVTLSVPSKDVTVGTPPPVGAEIEKMVVGLFEHEEGNYAYAYHEDPTDPKPEGERANLAYFEFYDASEDGGLSLNVYSHLTLIHPMGMGELKQQGAVGEDGIFLTAVAEGTPITFDAMVTSTWGYLETLYKDNHKVLATGTDIYIAFACGNGKKKAEGGTSTDLRAWAKINLGAGGTLADFKLIEAYVCLNDGEFKVGQTK